jgi:hypothetical protein
MCIIQVPYHGVSFGCPDFVVLLEIGNFFLEDQKDNFQKRSIAQRCQLIEQLLVFSIRWEEEAT